MGKQLIPGLGKKMYKMNLRYLAVSESKDGVTEYCGHVKNSQERAKDGTFSVSKTLMTS